MTSLKKQADDLGIEIDGRWSDETLKEKIEEARAKKTASQTDPAPSTTSTAANAGAPDPAPTPSPGEAKVVPNIGVGRVQTAEEVQQAKEGQNLPVAPYQGDPKEAHALAVNRSEREAAAVTANDIPAIGMPPASDEAKEELYPIRLLFDWWDGQGNRHPMDEIVNIPGNEAKKLLDEGKGEYAGKMTPIGG